MRPIHHEIFGYYYSMWGCFQAMPEADKEALAGWEKIHMDGRTAVTAWPGWKKYIGEMPTEPEKPCNEKRPIDAKTRWQVFLRDDFRCVDCGMRTDLSVDHIIPEILRGSHDLHNFCTRCRSCNSKKGKKMPEILA